MDSYTSFIHQLLYSLPPERAHDLVVWMLSAKTKLRWHQYRQEPDDPVLECRFWGRTLTNPIGLAAGLDKNASAIDALLGMGFGLVEVGAVTPEPRKGNIKPRLFRLKEDEGIINRFGFPNDGLVKIGKRLDKHVNKRSKLNGLVGCNIGVNDGSDNVTVAINDYVICIKRLVNIVDYIVINLSCPNTPGLRALQNQENIRNILSATIDVRDELSNEQFTPLLLKIDPDLSANQNSDIIETAIEFGVNGLVVSNTTTTRPNNLKSKYRGEKGGLSGRPLFELSNKVLREVFALTRGRIPLIGVGGVSSGLDAYTKIRAGATLVQMYTALVYGGPVLVDQIKRDLSQLLRKDGYENIQDAVGADVQTETLPLSRRFNAVQDANFHTLQNRSISKALVS